MDVRNILAQATEHGASDIFIIAGRPLTYKKRGQMEALDDVKLFAPDTLEFVINKFSAKGYRFHGRMVSTSCRLVILDYRCRCF